MARMVDKSHHAAEHQETTVCKLGKPSERLKIMDFCLSNLFRISIIRERGGIGRRARFRSLCP